MHYSRQVFVPFSFIGWLGSVVGIEIILYKLAVFCFGGYAQFNSKIEIINNEYSEEGDGNCENSNLRGKNNPYKSG